MTTRIIIALGLLLAATAANAQTNRNDEGYYWNIEYVPGPVKHTLIKVYNPNDILVYQEVLKGKKLNIDRKSVQRKLSRLAQGVGNAQAFAKR
jgi:hypothetical protein